MYYCIYSRDAAQKFKFSISISSVNVTKSAEILNGKLEFLCSESSRKDPSKCTCKK